MPFFQKRPVVIEARQLTKDNVDEILNWITQASFVENKRNCYLTTSDCRPLVIKTLEGDHHATIGDWIIQGVKGEFYPCKPDIFEMTYQPLIKQEDN